jgi:hypothetical protein
MGTIENKPALARRIESDQLSRALAGYDEQFCRELATEIIKTITGASLVANANVVAIRTGETLNALAVALVTVLAMVPVMDTPSELRKAAEALVKRIRCDVARARAQGVFNGIGA